MTQTLTSKYSFAADRMPLHTTPRELASLKAIFTSHDGNYFKLTQQQLEALCELDPKAVQRNFGLDTAEISRALLYFTRHEMHHMGMELAA